MERITTEQLLQIIGEKQVMLDLATGQVNAMERVAREHMAKEHAADEEPTGSMQSTADRIEHSLDTAREEEA